MLTGQSLDAAESALTASIMRFQGDVQVSPDGQLVYTFDELRLSAGPQQAHNPDHAQQRGGGMSGGGHRARQQPAQHQATPPVGVEPPPIWTREAAPSPMTGNEGWTDLWIALFNAFNLLMAFIAIIAGVSLGAGGILIALAGVVPLVFSGLFFFIPLVRLLIRAFAGEDTHKENARRQAIRMIYESVQGGLARPIPLNRLPAHLSTELIRDFDGDVRNDERGQPVVVFAQLAAQLDAAEQARRLPRQAAAQFGQVVFSSDEERFDERQADLDDFDRRLALDLGGSEAMFDFAPQKASAGVSR
jgi:hypothetical protein